MIGSIDIITTWQATLRDYPTRHRVVRELSGRLHILIKIKRSLCHNVVDLKQYHHASFIFAKVNTNLTIYTVCSLITKLCLSFVVAGGGAAHARRRPRRLI